MPTIPSRKNRTWPIATCLHLRWVPLPLLLLFGADELRHHEALKRVFTNVSRCSDRGLVIVLTLKATAGSLLKPS